MQPYVETHQAAKSILIVTAVASPLLEGAVTAYERVRSAEDTSRTRAIGGAFAETATLRTSHGNELDRGTKWILVGSMLAAIVLGWWAASAFPGAAMPGGSVTPFVIGLVLIWCGVGLRLWSVATLGRFFRRVVTIEQGHRIVAGGPYRLLRHPAYLGNLLATTGVGVALGNWVSLVVLIVLPTLGHLPRIRVEEGELERNFGEQYTSYAAARNRLVPGIW